MQQCLGLIGQEAHVGQPAALCQCRGLIRERVSAAVVLDAITTQPTVSFHQHMCIDDVRERRREIERTLALLLILSSGLLIVRVWSLKPGLRRDDIELNSRARRRVKVEAIEEVGHVSVGVQRLGFGRVKESTAQGAVDRQEIADAIVPTADTERGGRCAKRSVSE